MEAVEQGRLRHQVFKYEDSSDSCWKAPPVGYVRLDVDGSVDNNRHATCGGLIRDSRGEWVIGFQKLVGYSPPMYAEVLAILTGLNLCIQNGYKNVLVYTDSMEAFQKVMLDGGSGELMRREVSEIRELIYSGDDIELHHATRLATLCADFLAKEAHQIEEELIVLSDPHPGCQALLERDKRDSTSRIGNY